MSTIFLIRDGQSYSTVETEASTVGELADSLGVTNYAASVNQESAVAETFIDSEDVVSLITKRKTGGEVV
jgi:hypothetical protein|tara:strand:- start:1243 stop:1452 length:210 start_codon:yes stop_codon:yes gene_type:complete